MLEKISEEQINAETQSNFRPAIIESGISILPFAELSDKDFERLSYLLIKKEIENKDIKNITDIALMQGVSERGRDCVLFNNGKVCGLVQCKKHQGRLTRPLVIKEITKFLLFSTLDSDILPDSKNFEYKLYVSNDFTETAIKLIHSFKSEIRLEIKSGNVDKFINELIEEYESFSTYKKNPPSEQINELLMNISVSSSNAIDLTARINKYSEILNLFFNVKIVVMIDDVKNLLKTMLDDYGLKSLTDEDLKIIQERIGDTDEGKRLNCGFVDFFGYSKNFFQSIKHDEVKDILDKVVNLTLILHKLQLKFIVAEIHKEIYNEITLKLLNFGKIHPFSIGIAAPYLFIRLSMITMKKEMSERSFNDFYPVFTKSKDELIKEVSREQLDICKKILNKDFSGIAGTTEEVNFKMDLFKRIYQGFSDVSDAEKVLSRDIEEIRPALDKIENIIKTYLAAKQTIVIKDGSFLDNKSELERIMKTTKSIKWD